MAAPLDHLTTALADRYRIERELGRGGMATVFLAEDLKHHRRVAIKVLDPEVGAAIGPERFLREIETVARLTHPHILPLFDSGAAGGLLYYVMPYVEGESLRDRLTREKQLPLEDAQRIAAELADALDYAHEHGIVHRDLKPENVLLQHGRALLADFGIARAVAGAGGQKLTSTGVAVGTPSYMSPEQVAGGVVDARSDVYGLGCVMYEMLAGQPPFMGPTAESLAHQHLNVPAPEVTRLRPSAGSGVTAALQRALAKTPADRFGTTGEFAAALVRDDGVAVPAARPSESGARFGRRARTVAFAGGALVLALAVVAAWQGWWPLPGSPGIHRPARKEWILVAEFDGLPGDSTLAAATRSLVSAALDQSSIVATVPRDQIRLALQLAGKPANTRVDADLARELAYRKAVRAVLEGDIKRIGKGYSVVLRVVDAESLKVVLTESAIAKNEDALISALGHLAEKLRAGLGENRSALQATRKMSEVATPSFEAYQLYVEAGRQSSLLNVLRAISLYRQALALDPDFASAWGNLALNFGSVGKMDSSIAAMNEALRRPWRLTTRNRLAFEAFRASVGGDLRGALAAYDRILQDNPMNGSALVNCSIVLASLGRIQEALELLRRSEKGEPFGVNQIQYGNEAEYLGCLGRFGEAREVLRNLRGLNGLTSRAEIEIAAGSWSAAESLSAAVIGDPRAAGDQYEYATILLANTQAARGALRTAAATFDRALEATRRSDSPRHENALRGRLMLAVVSGGVIGVPADDRGADNSAAAYLTRGLRAAIAGDRVAAQRLLEAARARPKYELAWQGATPVLLAARIEALQGRWDEAARMLQPVASQPIEIGATQFPAGMSAVRWFLADAFERLGRSDSAAVYLERAVSDPAPAIDEGFLRGIVVPFAHLRLITLYARMGRPADAERHLAVLERWWDRTDDVSRPMLEAARTAVRSVRGMARPEAGRAAPRPSQPG